MKYEITGEKIRLPERKKLNEQCLAAVEGDGAPMTAGEIYGSFTGVGGLHGLNYARIAGISATIHFGTGTCIAVR